MSQRIGLQGDQYYIFNMYRTTIGKPQYIFLPWSMHANVIGDLFATPCHNMKLATLSAHTLGLDCTISFAGSSGAAPLGKVHVIHK